jgi:acyl carrier protein
MEILQDLTAIFKDVFERDALAINPQSCPDDFAEWDSLGHIQLVDAIEKHYKIKFSAREIRSWKNVGELCDCIAAKLPT